MADVWVTWILRLVKMELPGRHRPPPFRNTASDRLAGSKPEGGVPVNTKRMGLTATAALVAAGLLAGPANAASRTETTVTHEIALDFAAVVASQTCGFPVELHTVGKEVAILHYDADGTLTSMTIVSHYDGYFLNPANGKTVSSRVSGPVFDVFNADGSISESWSGSTVRTVPGSGLVSGWIGRESFTLVPTGGVDEEGFPIYDVLDDTFHGQFLWYEGVCAVLG